MTMPPLNWPLAGNDGTNKTEEESNKHRTHSDLTMYFNEDVGFCRTDLASSFLFNLIYSIRLCAFIILTFCVRTRVFVAVVGIC